MHKTPRQACPYRINVSHRLSEEIFSCIKDLLTCVSQYGLEMHQSKGTTTIKIWSKRNLELFFNDILGAASGGLPTKVINNVFPENIQTPHGGNFNCNPPPTSSDVPFSHDKVNPLAPSEFPKKYLPPPVASGNSFCR